jgi:hypothetical protein
MNHVAHQTEALSASVTLRGREVTRQDVLEAITTHDAEGKAAFLSSRGYRDSVRYHLRHDGRSYPSKAILGAAAGLDSSEFFGGARETVALLAKLGFHVRNSETGEVEDEVGLDAIRSKMVAEGFNDPAPEWPTLPVAPSAYFASGSNRPGEIRGLSKVGADIGVAAPELGTAAEAELHKLAGTDVLVFVDSGAFSEVKFNTDRGAFEVVREITDADWLKRLDLYRRLATSLGSQLFCVAPDQVGSQAVTLQRLARYAPQVRELHELGARVLVAVQKGELSQVEFARRVDEILGFDSWVAALPCKKAATSPDEVDRFLADRRPAHIHLLGLGIRNRKADAYLAPFVNSSTSVSLDSCWIAANVGRGKSRPRRYTSARDFAEIVLRALGLFSGRLKNEAAIFACLAAPLV